MEEKKERKKRCSSHIRAVADPGFLADFWTRSAHHTRE